MVSTFLGKWARLAAAVITIVASSVSTAGAQTGAQLDWVRQFGTPGSQWESGRAVAAADGAVYVVGAVEGALPAETFSGGVDAFIRKFNAQGAELWTRQFGTAAFDVAFGVATHASGTYVVGVTSGVLPGQSNLGGADAFVRKYDAQGIEVWTRQFGFPMQPGVNIIPSDSGHAIFVDDDGVFIVGTTETSDRDAFLRRYDFNGNVIFTRQIVWPGVDQANAITGDSSGVYVAGDSSLYATLVVRKFDRLGNELWTQFGPGFGNFDVMAIAVDQTGVYVAGKQYSGYWHGFLRKYAADSGNGIWLRDVGGYQSGIHGAASAASGVYVTGPGTFVRKYDADGNEEWMRQLGPAWAEFESIAVDGANIYVTGSIDGTFPDNTSMGGTDIFAAKLTELPRVLVNIDIKPGVAPNPINLGTGGTVAVAILSAPLFDATNVDPATVTLAGAAVTLRGRGSLMASIQDVNHDGLPDLIVHVSVEALQLTNGDVEAVLEGKTRDGRLVEGRDSVRVVP